MRILYVTRHFNHSGFLILERLIQEGFDIRAVLLHDDHDPWRGALTGPLLRMWYRLRCWYYRCPPLRTLRSEERLARSKGIPIIWADSIKSDAFHHDLVSLDPDIIVLGGGWHELIPERVYSHAPLGCLNTHPSLLPMFRGTSITRWQVLHGVERSGSTIHYVDDTFDTGGVLAQRAIDVSSDWSPQRLFDELGRVGADLMPPLLRSFEATGRQQPFHVQHDARYYKYFKRWEWSMEKLRLDWSGSLRELHYKVLACTQESYQYLGPFFTLEGERYILRRTSIAEVPPDVAVQAARTEGIFVARRNRNSVSLYRRGEPVMLVLERVQRFDGRYKYRRSISATRLALRTGGAFRPE